MLSANIVTMVPPCHKIEPYDEPCSVTIPANPSETEKSNNAATIPTNERLGSVGRKFAQIKSGMIKI